MQTQTFDGVSAYMRANVSEDPKMFACFVTHPVLNDVRSKQEARPVFEPKSYIRIERAGERDVLMREATELDKQRFREQWKAYTENREFLPSGSPLETLFPNHPEVVATLKYCRVHTVEQLAEISDTAKQTIGLGATEWQNKAIEFLKAAQGAQGYHALKQAQEESASTITKLTQQISLLEQRLADKPATAAAPNEDIAALKAQVAELMNAIAQPKKPGRKPKEEAI